jgi:S-adenosylmethionine:tRNA-ribosyltransferase-isomerase (queuine synthetase)
VNVFDGWTNKFIFPPYQYSVPDAAVSNFHLPQSTMLMCVAAFGGYDNVMNAYKVASRKDTVSARTATRSSSCSVRNT